MFGSDAVLVRAKSLAVNHRHIEVRRAVTPVSYIQITLVQQGIVFAQGVPIEAVLLDAECDFDYMTLRSWELMAAVA